MPLFHIVILAIVQGISEFLPISSSGHLILAHAVLSPGQKDFWGDTLTLDIAVHIGTLLAALLYFRKDILVMVVSVLSMTARKTHDSASTRRALFLVVASVPVLALGFVLSLLEPAWTRSLTVTGVCLIAFGILLGAADRFFPERRSVEDITLKDALFVGMAQMLALIPGTSRSGITMTAARACGFTRVEAARFSLLLAVIAISGAGAVGVLDIIKNPDSALIRDALIGIAVSFVAGFAAIHFLMKWLARSGFMPFAIYRIALGVLILALVQAGVL